MPAVMGRAFTCQRQPGNDRPQCSPRPRSTARPRSPVSRRWRQQPPSICCRHTRMIVGRLRSRSRSRRSATGRPAKRRLPYWALQIKGPAWSPAGRRLAYLAGPHARPVDEGEAARRHVFAPTREIMCGMAGTAGDWMARHDEVGRYLSAKRRSLRALAAAQCEHDARLLGAVYQLKDGLWLWHQGSRLTPEESRREYLENAADEYGTRIENGENRTEAWEKTLGAVSEQPIHSPGRSDRIPRVAKLGDPESTVRFYRASSLAEIARPDRDLRGAFSSCPKCRLTYLIEYQAMHYATGKAAVDRITRPAIVLPGRVIPDGTDPRLATAPAYGLVRPWQATPWRLC
jgi:hypothetical protein